MCSSGEGLGLAPRSGVVEAWVVRGAMLGGEAGGAGWARAAQTLPATRSCAATLVGAAAAAAAAAVVVAVVVVVVVAECH